MEALEFDFFSLVSSLKLTKGKAPIQYFSLSPGMPKELRNMALKVWRAHPEWQGIDCVSCFDPAIAPLIGHTVALSCHLNTLRNPYSRQTATVCFPEGAVREKRMQGHSEHN